MEEKKRKHIVYVVIEPRVTASGPSGHIHGVFSSWDKAMDVKNALNDNVQVQAFAINYFPSFLRNIKD